MVEYLVNHRSCMEELGNVNYRYLELCGDGRVSRI